MLTLNSDFEEIGAYYHPGHLNHLLVQDIDQDSKDEILVTGSSNIPGYQGGAFILFDEGHISGAAVDSVTIKNGWPKGNIQDGSLRRILIPSMPEEFMLAAGASRFDGDHSNCCHDKEGNAEISISLYVLDKAIILRTDSDLRLRMAPIPTDPLQDLNEQWLSSGKVSRDYLSPDFLDEWASGILRFEKGRLNPIQ